MSALNADWCDPARGLKDEKHAQTKAYDITWVQLEPTAVTTKVDLRVVQLRTRKRDRIQKPKKKYPRGEERGGIWGKQQRKKRKHMVRCEASSAIEVGDANEPSRG